jgi:IS30 family transposase
MAKPRWNPSSEDLQQIEAMAASGLTQEQIAHNLGICRDTIYRHKKTNSRLSDAIKKGQAAGIEKVANALFNSAINGNVAAQIFYLKSRAGWRETGGPPGEVQDPTTGIELELISDQTLPPI